MTSIQEDAPRAWSAPARAALLAGALLLSGAALWHGAMLFLAVAPSNGISRAYEEQIIGHTSAEFGQDWKLFAPNPMQVNVAISARVRTDAGDGSSRVGPWVDLTAQDIDAIRGNPWPSHAHQNMLRRAWDFYAATHRGENGTATDPRADLSEQYLQRVVLQRIGPDEGGRRADGIQLRRRMTLVEPPSWRVHPVDPPPGDLVLPWWPVAPKDVQAL
ncbi:DUF5819 family protein [Streptomyces sp. LARHCF249]